MSHVEQYSDKESLMCWKQQIICFFKILNNINIEKYENKSFFKFNFWRYKNRC